jgi:transcription elongation factor GreA
MKEFNIVSHLEADPMANKISDQSPLGVALIGKKIDDLVEVSAPAGKITYKIVSIH